MGLGSGIRDPGSGKNLFRIPDPEVKKAPDPGSGSATLFNTLQVLLGAHLRRSYVTLSGSHSLRNILLVRGFFLQMGFSHHVQVRVEKHIGIDGLVVKYSPDTYEDVTSLITLGNTPVFGLLGPSRGGPSSNPGRTIIFHLFLRMGGVGGGWGRSVPFCILMSLKRRVCAVSSYSPSLSTKLCD
jgi:hypothetical protein